MIRCFRFSLPTSHQEDIHALLLATVMILLLVTVMILLLITVMIRYVFSSVFCFVKDGLKPGINVSLSSQYTQFPHPNHHSQPLSQFLFSFQVLLLVSSWQECVHPLLWVASRQECVHHF